jgi:hypothetical protein
VGEELETLWAGTSKSSKESQYLGAMEEFAKRIHEEVYRRFYSYKTTIFLCGAGPDKVGSVREKISEALTTQWYSYQYDLFQPEDLFEELISGPSHQDLISLENMLADSVDAVVLAVESCGAFAELGSFASNPKLRRKLVCLVDHRYRKDRSFINFGPLRLLKDKKEGEIIYIDFANPASAIETIRKSISKIRKQDSKSAMVANVVQAHHFVLPCIYLFEPVSRTMLAQLVGFASGADRGRAKALTAGALAILSRRKEVETTPDGYRLSLAGLSHFADFGRRGRTGYTMTINVRAMDDLRIAILNWQYRGKSLSIG